MAARQGELLLLLLLLLLLPDDKLKTRRPSAGEMEAWLVYMELVVCA